MTTYGPTPLTKSGNGGLNPSAPTTLVRDLEEQERELEDSIMKDQQLLKEPMSADQRAVVTKLLAAKEQKLENTRKARQRAGKGSYGVCEECQKEINTDRLAVLPLTSQCVDCSRDSIKVRQ